MITQEVLNDAYLLIISGAAKMKNDTEIEWHDEGEDITIEFPTLSISYAVIKEYYKNGVIWRKTEYHNGKQHGKTILYHMNGNIYWSEEYQNGKKD